MRIIEIAEGIKKVVDSNVLPGDDVLILGSTDLNPLAYEALAGICSTKGCEVILLMMSPRSEFHSEEPPAAIAKAMLGSNVVFQSLSTSLALTKSTTEAAQAGVRIISMYLNPGQEIALLKSFAQIDVKEVKRYTLSGHELIVQAMKQSRQVHLTSDLGTDLQFRLNEYTDQFYSHWGITVGPDKQALGFTAWPPGTIHPFLDEKSAHGTLIADVAVSGVEHLSEPVQFDFLEGQIVGIKGGAEINQLKEKLMRNSPSARTLSMVGIGSNPFVQSSELGGEGKRSAGVFSLEFGGNFYFPLTEPSTRKILGKIHSSFHRAAVARGMTCLIGAKKIVSRGVPCWE